jgi:hypothetical protein
MYPRKVAHEHAVKIMNDLSVNAEGSHSLRAVRAFARALVPLRRAGNAIAQIPSAMKAITRTAHPKSLERVR